MQATKCRETSGENRGNMTARSEAERVFRDRGWEEGGPGGGGGEAGVEGVLARRQAMTWWLCITV